MNKTTTATPRRLRKIAVAAEYADVHPITVRRWISAGRLPAYRVGPKLLKVDLNELDAMLTPIPTADGPPPPSVPPTPSPIAAGGGRRAS